MRLMCDFALDYRSFEQQFGIDFKTHFADALDDLAAMQEDRLVRLHDDGMEVLTAGRLLIRNIAMVFDEYLRKKNPDIKFSKVI